MMAEYVDFMHQLVNALALTIGAFMLACVLLLVIVFLVGVFAVPEGRKTKTQARKIDTP